MAFVGFPVQHYIPVKGKRCLWIVFTLILFCGCQRWETSRKEDWKKIVIANSFFEDMDVWKDVFRRLISKECEESRCSVSLNEDEIQNADAVIFHAEDLTRHGPKLSEVVSFANRTRKPNQIFVFYSMEPPTRFPVYNLHKFQDFFNWTMTYRRDSDVVELFGKVTKRKEKRPLSEINFVTEQNLRRKKFAVWVSSHCPKKTLPRERFMKSLQRYIPIDKFGACGRLKDMMEGKAIYGTEVGSTPIGRESLKYAFHLTLENSLCDDYVTEKVFRAWKFGVIPIVFGAVNYSSFAPPKSFIDHRDFPTIRSLADHLKSVASNPKLYNEYLAWQEHYDVEVGSPYKPFVCDLCKKLHSNKEKRKWYPSIYEWYFQESNCQI